MTTQTCGPLRRLVASATAGLMLGSFGASPASAQDDFSFDIVEEQVTDTDKQRVEDAKDLVARLRDDRVLG